MARENGRNEYLKRNKGKLIMFALTGSPVSPMTSSTTPTSTSVIPESSRRGSMVSFRDGTERQRPASLVIPLPGVVEETELSKISATIERLVQLLSTMSTQVAPLTSGTVSVWSEWLKSRLFSLSPPLEAEEKRFLKLEKTECIVDYGRGYEIRSITGKFNWCCIEGRQMLVSVKGYRAYLLPPEGLYVLHSLEEIYALVDSYEATKGFCRRDNIPGFGAIPLELRIANTWYCTYIRAIPACSFSVQERNDLHRKIVSVVEKFLIGYGSSYDWSAIGEDLERMHLFFDEPDLAALTTRAQPVSSSKAVVAVAGVEKSSLDMSVLGLWSGVIAARQLGLSVDDLSQPSLRFRSEQISSEYLRRVEAILDYRKDTSLQLAGSLEGQDISRLVDLLNDRRRVVALGLATGRFEGGDLNLFLAAFRHLEQLNVSGTDLSKSENRGVVWGGGRSHVTKLDASNCKLTDRHMREIRDHGRDFNKRLSAIRLSRNSLLDKGVIAFAQTLPNYPALTKVVLESVKMTDVGFGALLTSCTQITTLVVSGNAITGKDMPRETTSLTSLDVSNNLLDLEGAKVMLRWLQKNRGIGTLTFTRDKLNSREYKMLCKNVHGMMHWMPSLQKLSMDAIRLHIAFSASNAPPEAAEADVADMHPLTESLPVAASVPVETAPPVEERIEHSVGFVGTARAKLSAFARGFWG